jgi:hypothetical protein
MLEHEVKARSKQACFPVLKGGSLVRDGLRIPLVYRFAWAKLRGGLFVPCRLYAASGLYRDLILFNSISVLRQLALGFPHIRLNKSLL